jgi:hypothetical protein
MHRTGSLQKQKLLEERFDPLTILALSRTTLGNDYNRNRIGPAKAHAGQMQVSTDMKNKLRGLADDPDLPDTARRAVSHFLAR